VLVDDGTQFIQLSDYCFSGYYIPILMFTI